MIADFFTNTPLDGWDVVLAVVLAVVGWIAAGFAKRGMIRLLAKVPALSAEASNLIARIVRYGILLLTLGIVLTALGAPLQPVLAAVILVAAVAALALRGIAANLGAGLVIQTRHVMHVDDEINVLNFTGVVKELNGRSVLLHTDDGRTVRIPNSAVLDNPLVNLTERGIYRSELEVRVEGDKTFDQVSEIITAALGHTDRVRSVPRPQALLAAKDTRVMTLRVRFWHDPHHRGEVRSHAIEIVVEALGAEGLPASVDWTIPPRPLTPPSEF